MTQYTYDGNNNLISMTDSLGNVTQYQYDGEDHLVKTIDANGKASTLAYDANGRVVANTDALGDTASTQYDAAGNITGQRDALGNQVISTTYDNLNNPVSVEDALGNVSTKQYDSLNRLVKDTDPLGSTVNYGYDDLNRLISSTDAIQGASSNSFDDNGNMTSLTDPDGNQTSFIYDKAGRLLSTTTSAGSTVTNQYSTLGQVVKKIDARGQETDYAYDSAGKLTSFNDPAGTVSYAYDANGNLLTVTDAGGTISREYDALNRITGYTDARGNTSRYSYDRVGNLVTLTYPGGRQVNYGYDAANRLTRVTDWAGRVTAYDYDANGRLSKTIRPDGTVQTTSYDKGGRLLEQKDMDSSGNIISQYDFTYDTAGNVTGEQSTGEPDVSSIPDSVMTYTNDNRLATINGQAVSYDADGNMTTGPLGGKMANFTYDARNRLTGADGVSYTYDAENNRIGVADSVYNSSISYVVNPNALLSQVLIAADARGDQTFYVYGLGLIGQEDTSGNYLSYHFDRRGSTVALTDSSGNVAASFRYGPYGELIGNASASPTPFLYNGRDGVMTDGNGLYYMRARYYNPDPKRFVNRDVLQGNISNDQSLNRYVYVNGKPESYTDPFGLCSEDNDIAAIEATMQNRHNEALNIVKQENAKIALLVFNSTAEKMLPDPLKWVEDYTGDKIVDKVVKKTGLTQLKSVCEDIKSVYDYIDFLRSTSKMANSALIVYGYQTMVISKVAQGNYEAAYAWQEIEYAELQKNEGNPDYLHQTYGTNDEQTVLQHLKTQPLIPSEYVNGTLVEGD